MAMALVAMDTTIVATAIPQVVGELGGFSLVGWVFSIYLLAQTVSIPVYGKLADLYGRKPVLVFGVVVFLVGSALSASSWNMLTLIAFRAMQGLGAGSDRGNGQHRGRRPVRRRGAGQDPGWLSSVWGISAVLGARHRRRVRRVRLLAMDLPWLTCPLGALALVLILRGLHQRVERHQHRIDYAGAAACCWPPPGC